MQDGRDLLAAFVNTRELLPEAESLGSPAALGAWLAGNGLAAGKLAPTGVELADAHELREALRALMLANNGVEVDAAAAASVVEEASRRAALYVRCDRGRATLEPAAAGVAGALGRICAAFATVSAAGTWPTVKACRASDCLWAFVDRAPNGRRTWCSMRSCGNREKARAYRERHAAGKVHR